MLIKEMVTVVVLNEVIVIKVFNEKPENIQKALDLDFLLKNDSIFTICNCQHVILSIRL